jgi:linoleoyl-CoA desaturase
VSYALAASGVDDRVHARLNGRRARAARKLRTARRLARRRTRNDDVVRAAETARDAYRSTVVANFASNIIRNLWAYAIIFCGHFPDQTYVFTEEEAEDESRGAAYVRQLIGAANIEGSPLFHVISGNLGYQVEHHLYPDMPSTRYGEIAPRVREICERYELPYNTGPFRQQLWMVQRSILRLAFPGGEPRPKPGPYDGPSFRTKGEREAKDAADAAA